MNRNFFIKKPTIEGFDTETYKGQVKLITCSTDYKEPKDFGDIIKFLWYHGANLNFFFNISFDFSVIARQYLVENPYETKEFRIMKRFIYEDFTISFIPNKGFTIKLGHRHKRYFDISQFYSDGYHRTLDYVAKTVLNEGKNNEELEIDRKKIGSVEGYYEEHREKIIRYGKKGL